MSGSGAAIGLKQEQRQILTAAQIQSLELLTLNTQELTEYLQQQLLENPVLEQDESSEATGDPPLSAPEINADTNWNDEGDGWDEGPGYNRSEEYAADRDPAFSQEDDGLERGLLLQLAVGNWSEAQQQAQRAIVFSLDEDGYLRTPLAELAAAVGIEEERLEQALRQVQALEPAGVGARSLEECLRLQVPASHPEHDLLWTVIDHHLSDLASGQLRSVSRQLGVSEKKVAQLFETIRSLSPRPALAEASSRRAEYIVPDIIVRKLEGEYQISLNTRYQPSLRVSAYYRGLLTDIRHSGDTDTLDYMRQKLTAAQQLIRNVERRRLTLLRIAEILVREQLGFLENGLPALAPLTMRQVADQAELHESTVCRAVAGKYIDTPRGVYALKFFFSRAYEAADGSLLSNAYVRRLIAELIAAEDKSRPLTDSQLEEALRQRGLNVARRTVAKYRGEMGLPKRSFRRRLG